MGACKIGYLKKSEIRITLAQQRICDLAFELFLSRAAFSQFTFQATSNKNYKVIVDTVGLMGYTVNMHYTFDMVNTVETDYTVDTVYTVETVYTIDTVYTVYTG